MESSKFSRILDTSSKKIKSQSQNIAQPLYLFRAGTKKREYVNSVEARAPFLDYRVIEFAFSSISSDLKANTKNTKIIIRKLAEKLLPPKISKLEKKGFELPLNLWLESGPFRDFFYDVLSSRNSIISKEILIKLFKNIKSKKNNPERLFALVQLQLWKDIYNIKF